MECEDFKEQVSLFIDGALEASKQQTLFRHLAECTDCQAFMEVSVQVRQTAAEEKIAVPQHVDEEILSVIGERTHVSRAGRVGGRRGRRIGIIERFVSAPPWSRHLAVPLPVAAVALLLIVLLATALSITSLRAPERGPGLNIVAARGDSSLPAGAVIVIYALPEEEVIGRPIYAKDHQAPARTF